MSAATKSTLQELQKIISKIPLQACSMLVVPEFGVRWREVSRAVRDNRLAMNAASVARVLCRHAARSLPAEEVEDIVARLRLKLIATQTRKWHAVKLQEQTGQLSVEHLLRAVEARVARAAEVARSARTLLPKVQAITMNDLLFLSVQTVSKLRAGPILYVATPPGEPVALVSSVSSSLLKAVVNGLGYKSFEDAKLFGSDIPSLLRIVDESHARAEHLQAPPEYAPSLNAEGNMLDFTAQRYNEQYVDAILGPDTPLLNELQMTSTRQFSPTKRPISLKIHIKSDDIAQTLRGWVQRGALAPTSEFLQLFNKIKSNKFNYEFDE